MVAIQRVLNRFMRVVTVSIWSDEPASKVLSVWTIMSKPPVPDDIVVIDEPSKDSNYLPSSQMIVRGTALLPKEKIFFDVLDDKNVVKS